MRPRKNDTAALFNYGFHFYETVTVYEPMTELDKPRIWKGQQDTLPVGLLEETVLTLPRGDREKLATEVDLQREIVAPIQKGDRVGTATLRLGDETVLEVPVVALVPVEQAGFFARLWDTILMFIASLFATRLGRGGGCRSLAV